MKRMLRRLTLVFVLFAMSGAASATHAAALDTARIEVLTGAKGKMDEKEGVFKVSAPRQWTAY